MKDFDHRLIVEDDGEGRAYRLVHPRSCPVASAHGGMYREYVCPAGAMISQWGLESYMPWWTLPDDTYRLAFYTEGEGEFRVEGVQIIADDPHRAAVLADCDPVRLGMVLLDTSIVEWDFDLGGRLSFPLTETMSGSNVSEDEL